MGSQAVTVTYLRLTRDQSCDGHEATGKEYVYFSRTFSLRVLSNYTMAFPISVMTDLGAGDYSIYLFTSLYYIM